MRFSLLRSFFLVLLSATLLTACDLKSGSHKAASSTAFGGTVVDGSGNPVATATVYLIPNTALNLADISAQDIRDGSAGDRDEPLEDAIAALGSTFSQATTNTAGEFEIDPVADGGYFVYVEPTDTEFFPGGSWCRDSVDATGLRSKLDAEIHISSSPGPSATYVGMTTCLVCHPEHEDLKGVAHRLGFTVPNQLSSLQSTSDHPELFDGNGYFLEGTVYTDGTPVYMWDPDWTRGFDKFQTSMTDPSSSGTLYAILWLWKDSNEKYYITIENKINPADGSSPATREVKLNYGGGVYKQRYMIDWPGLNGLYPLLQYQTLGDEAKYDRTRQQFRDYHFDFFWDNAGTTGVGTDDLIKTPSIAKNISLNCMGCHATGYTQFEDSVTGEILCDSVEDPAAEFDIDGDGVLNDLNIGCETCHGPGSEHVAWDDARYIVAPQVLTPSREVMLCDRCHDRLEGNGPFAHNDIPMNDQGEFPLPGTSRADFLANYVTTFGPKASKNWPDDIHAKSHHQQTPDFYKSKHYRNSDELLTCSSCHEMHGGTGYPSILAEDPLDPAQPLCMTCHQEALVSTVEHTTKMLGVPHGAAVATCVDCHMVKTAKTGAGDYGYLLDSPTGTSADKEITYFENDITSHVFDVPRKTNVGVRGIAPASAMPIPYTNSCGTCHDPSNLKF
jgi:predicted CXXCH cytochrome family protein